MTDRDAQEALRAFVEAHGVKCLNVAGSRGSKEPGLHGRVVEVLRAALRESEG
ncbi:putative molybdenum carrier protein [Verrucomicrobiaceae bacterium E54]|nr:putative molybdenum carrier protein [Verrucomicrobiaceae bacterium E54]